LKTLISVLPRFLLLLLAATNVVFADAARTEFDGHTKLRVVGQTYPADSVFRDLLGSRSVDTQGDLRLNMKTRKDGWTFAANYQLAVLNSELLQVPNDDRRFFNLTSTIKENETTAILHRLDRLWIGFTSEKVVLRFGRQALSWGNGLFYAPMDLVNPFDPSSVDTEYKAGDDMLYSQYLQDSGADMQGAYVIRRDVVSGDVESDKATGAFKYHGFAGAAEYDVLLAEHYGDTVIGVGIGHALGGAQWGGDLVATKTDRDTYLQLVTNISYSWVFADKNMSGALEYHFNGFGQKNGEYSPQALLGNPDLLVRLARGEMFTVGRHYLAGSVMIELTPLWTVSPTLLSNAEDPSALLQLVTSYSLADNATLLGSLNIPLGSNGSEFGGIESGAPEQYLSSGGGVFVQLAWYF
jgi:hypothetical protein